MPKDRFKRVPGVAVDFPLESQILYRDWFSKGWLQQQGNTELPFSEKTLVPTKREKGCTCLTVISPIEELEGNTVQGKLERRSDG